MAASATTFVLGEKFAAYGSGGDGKPERELLAVTAVSVDCPPADILITRRPCHARRRMGL